MIDFCSYCKWNECNRNTHTCHCQCCEDLESIGKTPSEFKLKYDLKELFMMWKEGGGDE